MSVCIGTERETDTERESNKDKGKKEWALRTNDLNDHMYDYVKTLTFKYNLKKTHFIYLSMLNIIHFLKCKWYNY